MTEKESSIINSAISLFAQEGYDGTSTLSIAKKAGVSEGLIFKHFKKCLCWKIFSDEAV